MQVKNTCDDEFRLSGRYVKACESPKIFAKNGRYYMVQGARDCESKGCVLLFESEDLMTWKYFDRIVPEEKLWLYVGMSGFV